MIVRFTSCLTLAIKGLNIALETFSLLVDLNILLDSKHVALRVISDKSLPPRVLVVISWQRTTRFHIEEVP